MLNFLTKFTWCLYGWLVNDYEIKVTMNFGIVCCFIALLGFLILKGDFRHWIFVSTIFYGCFRF